VKQTKVKKEKGSTAISEHAAKECNLPRLKTGENVNMTTANEITCSCGRVWKLLHHAYTGDYIQYWDLYKDINCCSCNCKK